MSKKIAAAVTLGLFVAVGYAYAGVDAGDLCKEKKAKASGRKAFDLLKAFGRNTKKPVGRLAVDISKAQSKFTKVFTKADDSYGVACPFLGDAADVEQAVDEAVAEILSLISLGPPTTTTTSTTTTMLPVLCGNGVLDGDEQCDPPDYGGANCGSLGFNLDGTLGCTAACQYDVSGCACQALPATGQLTSYGPGDDGDVRAGGVRLFTDNGDGTITDDATGLMWEKKEDLNIDSKVCKTELSNWPSCANPHDTDNLYEWCADVDNAGGCDNPGDPFDGPLVTVFLEQLNNRCDYDPMVDCTVLGDVACSGVVGGQKCGFAGYRDWRLPNRVELESLVNGENAIYYWAFDRGCSPSCDLRSAGWCSCTFPSLYWSSTTHLGFPDSAWAVHFTYGELARDLKYEVSYARAVRGGLAGSPSAALLDLTSGVLD